MDHFGPRVTVAGAQEGARRVFCVQSFNLGLSFGKNKSSGRMSLQQS